MKRCWAAALVLAVSILHVVEAWAGEFVVLEVRGPALSALARGTVLLGSATLEVPEHAEVTLLADTGQIIRVTGPARRPLAELARGRTPALSLVRLADLLRGGGEGRYQLGFTRGGIGGAPTDPWAVDITTAGAKCIFADHPVFLWRPPLSRTVRVSLEATSRSRRTFFDWPARTGTVAWPSDVPLESSETYLVTSGNEVSRTFTLTLAPKRPEPGLALVHFAESGCTDQFAVLLRAVGRGQD